MALRKVNHLTGLGHGKHAGQGYSLTPHHSPMLRVCCYLFATPGLPAARRVTGSERR